MLQCPAEGDATAGTGQRPFVAVHVLQQLVGQHRREALLLLLLRADGGLRLRHRPL